MIHTKSLRTATMAVVTGGLCLFTAGIAFALEYPIGKPQIAGGLEVAAVYLQPIEMDPPGMMRPAGQSDIHLEADIRAIAGNVNGFGEDQWVPYLRIEFELTKRKTGEAVSGHLMPMVASDGPHYGDNVRLMGAGTYGLKLRVSPPASAGPAPFGRHTDRETGVASWFAPFTTEYEFTYAGTGKKGVY